MPEWLTNLFSLSREISSKIALPILVATLLVLFLPDEYAATLGVDQFRDAFRIWIGVILLISAAALTSNFLWAIGRFIKPYIKEKILIHHRKKHLHHLTEQEKDILRRFIDEGLSEVHAEISNGTINLLEGKNIITRASSISVHHTTWAYILQPWARQYLEIRPGLLR